MNMNRFYYQMRRILFNPQRAFNILAKRIRTLRWDRYASLVREPKTIVDEDFQKKYLYRNSVEQSVDSHLTELNIKIEDFSIDINRYYEFFDSLKKNKNYTHYFDFYGHHIYEKIFEIFLTESLLEFKKGGTYIDIGSEFSIARGYFSNKYNCNVYSLDLQYKPGIHGSKIGANAENIPLPDNSVDGMFLHCSFEHFEKDSDMKFILEANRILKPGGWVLITPLYVNDKDIILTDPVVSIPSNTVFYDNMVACVPRWWNSFGRLMSPETLKSRTLKNFINEKGIVYKIKNAEVLHEETGGWISKYALMLSKDDPFQNRSDIP